jgi:hypothetical protein
MPYDLWIMGFFLRESMKLIVMVFMFLALITILDELRKINMNLVKAANILIEQNKP